MDFHEPSVFPSQPKDSLCLDGSLRVQQFQFLMVVRNYNCTRTMSPIQNQLAELFCQLVICSIPWSWGNPWPHVLVLLCRGKRSTGFSGSLPGSRGMKGQQVLPRTVWKGGCWRQPRARGEGREALTQFSALEI